MKRSKLLRKQLFLHSKKWLAISIFTVIILSIYNIVVSWLLQKIIDIAAGNDATTLTEILLITIVSFAIFMIAYVFYRTARPRYIQTAMSQYKSYIFEKILDKRISSISNESTGKIISALTNDMRPVEDYYLDSILSILDISVSFVGALALMLWYSPSLTVVSILLSILPILVSIPSAKKLADKEKMLSDKNENYVETIKDILSGFTVIKSFRIEKEIQKRFQKDNEYIEEAKYERRYAEENVNLLSTAASVMMRLGVFIIGAWMAVSRTDVTPGIVLVFLQLVTFVIYPIEKIPKILANRKAAIAIMDKLADTLSEENNESSDMLQCTMAKQICVNNVTFHYTEEKNVLQDINIQFDAGKKYAIVGDSGSGKTTLLNLLMRTYDGYRGSIQYDGIELSKISLDSLFQTVSSVQQNVFVFNDTIYNNVTLYKHFPEKDIQTAMDQAGLTEIIHTHGKDYVCGENGNALSGGEKQRISIARALLRKTSVLFLDEATAALDEMTANEIMSCILSIENMTSIVITHRLDDNLLKQYDKIIVLHNGKVEECDTFDNLLEKKGFFYSLYTVTQ